MSDVKKITELVVLGVYVALLLVLLRPAGIGPDLLTHTGVALAAVTGA